MECKNLCLQTCCTSSVSTLLQGLRCCLELGDPANLLVLTMQLGRERRVHCRLPADHRLSPGASCCDLTSARIDSSLQAS